MYIDPQHYMPVDESSIGRRYRYPVSELLYLNITLSKANNPVIIQEQGLGPRQEGKPVQLPDLVVAEVEGVELVERGAQVLDDGDLVAPQVQLPVPHRVDILRRSLNEVRS